MFLVAAPKRSDWLDLWSFWLAQASQVEFNAYLEVQRNEREDESLEVLHQVVEDPQPLWVFRLVHVDQGSDLGSLWELTLAQCNSAIRRALEPTSKEMCSLPNLISSSCRPSLFFCGHLVSSSLYEVSQTFALLPV